MRKYNILWIDDEHKRMSSFLTDAELVGIDIIPFQTSKDGLEAFENDILKWDGIILDAKCWSKSENEIASTDAMYLSIEKITELRYKRHIPFFIYTGQPDLYSDEQFSRSLRGRRFYKKGSEADKEQLFDDIKSEAEKLIETQVKHKYTDVLEFSSELSNDLIKILVGIERYETTNSSYLPDIRKILEWVMEYCNAKGVLPNICNKSNISECSRFIGQKDMKKYIPSYIQRNFHSCVEITNNGSHTLEADTDVKSGKATYLIRSTTFELLNILLWCKSLATDEESIAKLRADISILIPIANETTIVEESIEGVVEQDKERNYHCGEYLLNYLDMSFKDIGRQITIIRYAKNTRSKTKEKYQYLVSKPNFRIID